MEFNILLVLAAVALAAAQSSVVSLFLIDINDTPQPLVGSIVSEENDTTIYSINCAKTVDTSDCGYHPGLMYTAGPTAVQYGLVAPYDQYGSPICSVDGTTSVVCTIMMTDIGDGSLPPETMTLGKDFIRSTQVTITAGPTQSGTGASAVKTEESTGDHQRWGLR